MAANSGLHFTATSPVSSAAAFGVGGAQHQTLEMFSFTFSPELLNVFWGLYSGSNTRNSSNSGIDERLDGSSGSFFIETISPSPSLIFAQPKQYYLFGFKIPTTHEQDFTKHLLAAIRHSVITAGIVVLVGIGSYCTYCSLRKLQRLLVRECEQQQPGSLTPSSSSSTSSTWWLVRLYNNYWTPTRPESKADSNSKLTASTSDALLSKSSDMNHYNNMETMKLNLTLDLEKNRHDKSSSLSFDVDDDTKSRIRSSAEGRRGKYHHEGEHFSASPVICSASGNGFKPFKTEVHGGRILVGGDENDSIQDDEEEFQIEYFGPASPSSSSTLSDHSETGNDANIYTTHRTGSCCSNSKNHPVPGCSIQGMISPLHNQAANVRRQLDFGDMSPISMQSSSSSQFHHHLPPLSASSSMSLSPSTPNTSTQPLLEQELKQNE